MRAALRGRLRRRAPLIGQHNDEVLQGAGYSADEIERLRSLGVLS